jgi:hypothetical protein
VGDPNTSASPQERSGVGERLVCGGDRLFKSCALKDGKEVPGAMGDVEFCGKSCDGTVLSSR